MAVVVIYWKRIWPFHHSQAVGIDAPKGIWRYVDKDIMIMWLKIFISCLPAGIIGVAFNDTFERLFYNPVSVAIALIVFGLKRRTRVKKPRLIQLLKFHITWQL